VARNYAQGKATYKELRSVPWSIFAHYVTYPRGGYDSEFEDSEIACATHAAFYVAYNQTERKWQAKRVLKYIKEGV
jgi:hypothetical protein